MDESENAPLVPPEFQPEKMPAGVLAPTFQIEDVVPILARGIPDPLRTPDSPPSPDSLPAPGSPQAPPATPDSPPARGSTQAPYSFQETNSFQTNDSLDSLESAQLGAPPSAISAAERPRTPITPKPRAIFITAALLALTLIVWFAASHGGWLAPDPLEIARAQLLDLDQGRWRAAYDLFSPRYRAEVSFETWRDMALMHSRMFHTREMRFADDREWNNGAALEAHLVAESGDRYLARFTLVYAEGQWWVDDLHWCREPDTSGQVTA